MTVSTRELERSQTVHGALEQIFAYFRDPRNLHVLTPPWMRFTVHRMPTEVIHEGCEIDYTIRWLHMPLRWTTVITAYEPNVRFADEQKRGPYKRWWHEHRFERIDDDATLMTDRIAYELPLGPLGAIVHALAVRRQLGQIMDFRASAIERLFPPPILIP